MNEWFLQEINRKAVELLYIATVTYGEIDGEACFNEAVSQVRNRTNDSIGPEIKQSTRDLRPGSKSQIFEFLFATVGPKISSYRNCHIVITVLTRSRS